MDFQTLLAIAIIAGVVFFVVKRKGKSSGGTKRAKSGAGGSISNYKNKRRK